LHTELFLKNIPKLLQGSQFSRAELYDFYSLFKSLSIITALSNDSCDKSGVDFKTFHLGIQENIVKGIDQAKKMFEIIDKQKTGNNYIFSRSFGSRVVS
jgi:hypothetical protein